MYDYLQIVYVLKQSVKFYEDNYLASGKQVNINYLKLALTFLCIYFAVAPKFNISVLLPLNLIVKFTSKILRKIK